MGDGASSYLSVCVAATCIPEFCIHDMLFTITGKLAHDGTGAGERSLETTEYKYNKNETPLHFCTSSCFTSTFRNGTRRQKVAVSDGIFLVCKHGEE